MKTKFILLISVLCLIVAGCSKEREPEPSAPAPTPTPMPKMDKVAAIFELAYGQRKKITYGKNEKIEISIQNVVDSVDVNCAFVDFQKPEDMLSVRTHAYLRINKSAELVKVSSKPCGAIDYRKDGDDTQDVVRYINEEIIETPAYKSDPSYFLQPFVMLFGEGTSIQNTSLRIFMAKSYPNLFEMRNAQLKDYKFIFILTSQ